MRYEVRGVTDARLTLRQAACLAVATVLAGGVITGVALERQSIALASFGLLLGVIFGCMLHSRRRRREEIQRLRRELRSSNERLRATRAETVDDQLSFAQRRIVAAVENERLAAAERQQALLSSLRDLRKELHQGCSLASERHEALLSSLRQVQREMSRTVDES